MPIRAPEPPPESVQEAIEGIRRLRYGGPEPEGIGGGASATVSSPHQVFTIDPRDIISGAGLDAAKSVGWRYLVGEATPGSAGAASVSNVAAAEVAEKDGSHSFSNRQLGWLPQKTRDTIEAAERLPEVISGDYDMAMLRIPAVKNIDALWLRNKGAGGDLIIPIASRSPEVAPGFVYTPTDFVRLLRGVIEEGSFDNRPKGLLERNEE